MDPMEQWEKDMIAGVNRHAQMRAMQRRMNAIAAKRRRRGTRKRRRSK